MMARASNEHLMEVPPGCCFLLRGSVAAAESDCPWSWVVLLSHQPAQPQARRLWG